MTGRQARRWFTAIPITARFYIMFAILLLAVAAVAFGVLRATQRQADASVDLARVAAVQRSLDRALTLAHQYRRAGAHDGIAGQRRLTEPRERLARAARSHLGGARDAGSRGDYRQSSPARRALFQRNGKLPARWWRRRQRQRLGFRRPRTAARGTGNRVARGDGASARSPAARRNTRAGRGRQGRPGAHLVVRRRAAGGRPGGVHAVGDRALHPAIDSCRGRGRAGAGRGRHGQPLRAAWLGRGQRAGAHDQSAGRYHAGHAHAAAFRGEPQQLQQPAGRSAGNGGLGDGGGSGDRPGDEHHLRRASDGIAAGGFIASAPGTRLRASQDRLAQLSGGFALQLHRGAPRLPAALPGRRGAQCLPQVVRAYGRLVVGGLRAGELHGTCARRVARGGREGQAAESRADCAAHGTRRARRQSHWHVARL